MTTVDLDLLRIWDRAWELPELWSALCHDDCEFTEEALARAWVRRFAHPATPVEIFEELLAMGEGHAATALLDLPAFQRTGGDSLSLLDRLATSQAERLRDFDQRAAVLRLRAARLGRPLAPFLRELEAARTACMRRGAAGDALLRAIEDSLSHWEADMPRVVTSLSSVPRAPRWPFDQSPAECCQWFVAAAGLESVPCPLGFLERWAAYDDASITLVIEMLSLFKEKVDTAAVAAFTDALERFLGCTAPEQPRDVTAREGGFLTTLRGLPQFGLPALVATPGTDGIPLFFPANARARLPADVPLGIVFGAGIVSPGDGALLLEPRHVFPLMRHGQQRALQVVRVLAPQIPPDRIRPPLPPTHALVFGRDRETERLRESTGTVVLVGGAGIGKTSLLLRYRRHAPDDERRIDDALGEHPRPYDHMRALIGGAGAIVACTPMLWSTLSLAFGREVTVITLGSIPADEIRAYLQDQFDLLDVHLDPPQALERLVWCSGGHPVLLDMLLREVWSQQMRSTNRRRAPIAEREVEYACSSPIFRETATRLLLAPLAQQPLRARIMVHLLELCDGTHDADRAIEQAMFVELFEPDVPSSAVLGAIDVLESASLVVRELAGNDRMLVSPSALARLVSYLVSGTDRILDLAHEGPVSSEQ